jgi:hypothetical protein
LRGRGGSMSLVFRSNSSYKPITNTAWVPTQLCKLQNGCTRLAAASDKVYQLLPQGRWFSPGTPDSSTTKTGRHDKAEILLFKSGVKTPKNQSINIPSLCSVINCYRFDNKRINYSIYFRKTLSRCIMNGIINS